MRVIAFALVFATMVDAAMDKIATEIDSILDAFQNTEGMPCTLAEQAYQLLSENKLAHVQQFQNANMGTNVRNRGGSVLCPQEVPAKALKFHLGGFVLSETKRAMCVERQPGAVGDMYEARNQEVAIKSGGVIAPIASGSLLAFSLTCGHTKEVLKAAEYGTVCNVEGVSINGKMSGSLMRQKNPSFGLAMDEGLHWRTIRWQVERRWPKLIDLFMEADNIPLAMAMEDTQLDLCWKILGKARGLESDGSIPWDAVEKLVSRTVHKRADEVPDLVAWTKCCAGGLKTPWVLEFLDTFQKGLPNVMLMPTGVLQKLAHIDFPPHVAVRWRVAVVCALLGASDAKYCTRKGESKYLSTNDIQTMTQSYRKFVLQAEDILQEVLYIHVRIRTHRNICVCIHIYNTCMVRTHIAMHDFKAHEMLNKSGLPNVACVALEGRLGMRLVAHVFQRPIMSLGTFTSLMHCAGVFFNDFTASMSEHGKPEPFCPEPWSTALAKAKANAKAKPKSKRSAGSGSAPSRAAELSCDGTATAESVLQYFQSRNCAVGTKCMHVKSKTDYIVDDIQVDIVKLHDATDTHITMNVKVYDFFGDFDVKGKPSEKMIHETWDYNFELNTEYQDDVAICGAKLALWDLHSGHAKELAKLTVTTSPAPNRGLTAKDDIAKHELVLVPVTNSVMYTKRGETIPPLAAELGHDRNEKVLYAAKKESVPETGAVKLEDTGATKEQSKQFIAPFWIISTTVAAKDANMETFVQRVPKEKYGHEYNVVCLRNCKAIKAGEDLKLFKSPASSAKYALETPRARTSFMRARMHVHAYRYTIACT